MLRRFMASRAEPAYIVFYWTDFELNGNFSFSDGLHMLCSTHKILSLERGLAACDSRTLIAHFLHKQEKGKDNEHPQPVPGYEESQSERHAEGRAQDVPLVKGQCGEGEQTRGLLYRPLFPCRVQRERAGVFSELLQPQRHRQDNRTGKTTLPVVHTGEAGSNTQPSLGCCGVCSNIKANVCFLKSQCLLQITGMRRNMRSRLSCQWERRDPSQVISRRSRWRLAWCNKLPW